MSHWTDGTRGPARLGGRRGVGGFFCDPLGWLFLGGLRGGLELLEEPLHGLSLRGAPPRSGRNRRATGRGGSRRSAPPG
jgi:hypothetical protein